MQLFTDVSQKVSKFASDNAAALLTAGGVVGTVATAVLTGRAGFKAAQILAVQQQEWEKEAIEVDPVPEVSPVPLTTVDKLKVVWPYFIPPVLAGSATITSIIMSNRMSAQKAAALAAAYGLAERNLSEYKEKVTEKLTGPKKQAIEEELSQDRVNRTDGYQNIVIVEGEVLCFDEPTARYFKSTMERIKSAVNATNAEILNHDYATATFFYEELELPATTWTDEVGWNTDRLLDLKIDTVLSPDGRPCISIDFNVLPRSDFVPKHY